jgi:RNA polymerase-binding transcription factor DksA
MRQHFHRCGHLRVLALEASELDHRRKGGSQILEELCDAKRLARCVGLAECDVLSPAEKRALLATRATRLREEEGGASQLADVPAPRADELRLLHREFLEEYEEIVEENRRRRVEAGAALQRNPRPIPRGEEGELAAAGLSIFLDDELRELRTARLDALDRALDAMARGGFGDCARCRRPIEIERLRLAPDSAVCTPCARAAPRSVSAASGASPAGSPPR